MNRTMNKATGTKSRALIAAYMLSIADISTLGTILHCQGELGGCSDSQVNEGFSSLKYVFIVPQVQNDSAR